MPVMNVAMYTTSQQEAEGRAAAHALPEHLLQGPGLLVLMDKLLEVRGLEDPLPHRPRPVPRRRRHRLHRRPRPHRRPGRRIRLRQERDLALDHGPGARARPARSRPRPMLFDGRDLLRPLGRRAPPAARRQDVDDLPGADDLAQPGPHHRRPDRRGASWPTPRSRRRRRRTRAIEMLELVRIPSAARAPRRLSAPAVRRHAPARDDRHGAGLRAGAADRRRADHRARRHHPGADPRADAATCSAGSAWRS